ncbi:hypothetical protein ATZ36_17660 [Candidatus Endomicrobiellum trichonymphae]|uniref:Uncharacterized protein n=1 Tax=Endomicrobium trichonymphae TaxID=1408204 RepID=A0A1E5ILG9_ENDTX|nr:hypothetical protein ATZ36_17660 [Candidatus Endomicrobium trichonymphae]
MQKMKRLNPYWKARLKYSRLTVKSDFSGREMIAFLKFIFKKQNSAYNPSLFLKWAEFENSDRAGDSISGRG